MCFIICMVIFLLTLYKTLSISTKYFLQSFYLKEKMQALSAPTMFATDSAKAEGEARMEIDTEGDQISLSSFSTDSGYESDRIYKTSCCGFLGACCGRKKEEKRIREQKAKEGCCFGVTDEERAKQERAKEKVEAGLKVLFNPASEEVKKAKEVEPVRKCLFGGASEGREVQSLGKPSEWQGLTQPKSGNGFGVKCAATHIVYDDKVEKTSYSFSTPAPTYYVTLWKPKNVNMSSYGKRMQTYLRWPKQLKQKSHELCASGFYYTGCADEVRCFYCGIGVHSWEPDDFVPYEHRRWSPNCKFLEMTFNLDLYKD